QNDATPLMMSHRMLGMSLFVLGELEAARSALEKTITLYDPVRHSPLALVFSHDFKATAQTYLGLTHVLMDDSDAGLAHSREALRYPEELGPPHGICYVLPFTAGTYLISGRPHEALPVAERGIAMSAEYAFPQWHAGGLLLRGWARTELGDPH